MEKLNRRQFLGGALLTGTALAIPSVTSSLAQNPPVESPVFPGQTKSSIQTGKTAVADFRFAPVFQETCFCFPDDPHKSLVSRTGQLLYGYDAAASVFYFPLKVGFALYGMQTATVMDQKLESPGVPILRTRLQYPGVDMVLTTFATNDKAEGRVDNVLVEVTPHSDDVVKVALLVPFDTIEKFDMDDTTTDVMTVRHRTTKDVLLVGQVFANPSKGTLRGSIFDVDIDRAEQLTMHPCDSSKAKPLRAFFRFPQEKQQGDVLTAGLANPDQCLASCRSFWKSWNAFQDPVAWEIPDLQGQFVEACARNILQAREVRDGKLTFQVGPTCYRGLWVVDGNFILESARYLGYDKDAIEGLRTTWSKQQSTGQIIASGGKEHWKDTAIAMFTLVRQCELSQDWSLMHELESQVVSAIAFLQKLHDSAPSEGSSIGKYDLLPKGFADGGIEGIRDEFTNTVWSLAGLKAIAAAGERQKIDSFKGARSLFNELQAAFAKAAPQEMRTFGDGQFQYLPMLMKNDPQWSLPDPWDRPRPQSAQWALSHAIFPGLVFDKQDPVLRGQVNLMQAVRKEDVPSETGWNHHESIWTYNAAFVAEVYLWLGMKQAAHDTFIGFLNHASPQYCWREEQPLQNALVGSYVGDMPHNWASAECIRYVRHMLALEDAQNLRLLAGITQGELASAKKYALTSTPTRFGRLNLELEPMSGHSGWKLTFERDAGPTPDNVLLPAAMGDRLKFSHIEGAHSKTADGQVMVDNAATKWSAFWKA